MAGTVTLTFTASPAPVGSACSAASDALMVTFSRPDRTVTGNEMLSGVYNNVLVTAGAVATTGTLDIAGSLGVQNGGRLAGDGACAPITGLGTFTLEDGAQLDICHSQGIALSGATGQIQVTGTRSYSAGATYAYVGSGAQSSGNGLPFNLTGTLITNNGGAGVDLTNGLRLHNRLRLINGDLRIGESASLTVVSNATGTGVIENQSGAVVGSATIQRYLESSLSAAVGYHHLSSPVTTAPVSDLNTAGFTAVVNPLYNTAINP